MHTACAGIIKKKVRETERPVARTYVEVNKMNEDELLERLTELVNDLILDYDRLSQSGKETYHEICSIVNKLQGG